VHRHKTESDHGAQRVTISDACAPILSNYIESNIHSCNYTPHPYAGTDQRRERNWVDKSPPLLDFPAGGFGAVWALIRKKNPEIADITSTANRHFLETKVRDREEDSLFCFFLRAKCSTSHFPRKKEGIEEKISSPSKTFSIYIKKFL
jgi:hypothetical protein